MQHSPGFLRISEEARARVTEISAIDLLARLAERSRNRPGAAPTTFTLIDVREDHEWQAGRIPGARHVGRGILERDIERTLPDLNSEIILYCGGGYRSALAADSLSRMGYRRVLSLAGGFRGWRDGGNAVEVDPATVKTLPLLPKHIVVAIDLTEVGRSAMLAALDLAAAIGARLTFVHAIEPTPTPATMEAYALEGMPTDWAQRINDARLHAATHQVQALVTMCERPGVAIDGQVIFGVIPDVVNALITKLGADLLVVGSHGRQGLSHFLLGSVAERLMRSAPCPVLVVRPVIPSGASAGSRL